MQYVDEYGRPLGGGGRDPYARDPYSRDPYANSGYSRTEPAIDIPPGFRVYKEDQYGRPLTYLDPNGIEVMYDPRYGWVEVQSRGPVEPSRGYAPPTTGPTGVARSRGIKPTIFDPNQTATVQPTANVIESQTVAPVGTTPTVDATNKLGTITGYKPETGSEMIPLYDDEKEYVEVIFNHETKTFRFEIKRRA